MSKYCGKCDLWDSLVMIRKANDENTNWSNIKIYQTTEDSYFDEHGWNNVKLLDIKCLKDLLPYAPFITSIMGYSEGKYTVYIPHKSYIDVMEEERLVWVAKDAKKVYHRCKRQKREYNVEDVANEITYFGWEVEDYVLEVVKRVKAHPYSFKLDGIRVPICEIYREYLYNDMIDMGYTEYEAYEWCWNGNKVW